MNTEEMFKYGITPKEGPNKGVRYAVDSICRESIGVKPWDEPNRKLIWLKHGYYEIWKEPKTLFQDSNIQATVGTLKQALEKSGVTDDTLILINSTTFPSSIIELFGESFRNARFRVADVSTGDKTRRAIIAY